MSFSFPSHSVLAKLELADRLLDPVAQALREVGGERGAGVGADQLLEGAPLRVGELHPCMVGIGTDMAETPDEILRALADPERLAIAGALAQRPRTAAALAKDLELQLTRVRKHLNRLTTTGVVRLEPDRRTYRLDPETLRWAAEQVGPPRGRRPGARRRERGRGDRSCARSSATAA